MAVHIENSYNKQKMLAQITTVSAVPTMTVSLPPLPEGWRDDVVYMLHDFLEDAGLAQTLCALEQETGYAPARHPPTPHGTSDSPLRFKLPNPSRAQSTSRS
jgi:hypothetical protein